MDMFDKERARRSVDYRSGYEDGISDGEGELKKAEQERDAARKEAEYRGICELCTHEAVKRADILREERDAAREARDEYAKSAADLGGRLQKALAAKEQAWKIVERKNADNTALRAAVGKMCEWGCGELADKHCVADCPLYPHRDTAASEPASTEVESTQHKKGKPMLDYEHTGAKIIEVDGRRYAQFEQPSILPLKDADDFASESWSKPDEGGKDE